MKIGTDFSGVGSAEYAATRIFGKENIESVFACDMDKYARKSYIACHGEPGYFPDNVYNREIPKESLDLYVSSPPCQAFSLAGKRLGKEDKRGILFFNTHEFIQQNKPRYFIIENVKGLLSDDSGKTFQEWTNLLGGKSVNGNMTIFPYDEATPYHIYWKVLNAKNHGVPQNRERVFIVGIRDDQDNNFSWPKEEYLKLRLKDILEDEVDEKYFLSDSNVKALFNYNKRQIENNRGFSAKFRDIDKVTIMDALKCGGGGKDDLIKIGTWRTHKDGQGFRETSDNNYPTIPARAREDGSGQAVICIPVLTPDRPNKSQNGRRFKEDGDPSFTLTTQDRHGIFDGYKIRRLTPTECARLMDFPEGHTEKCREAGISDSQLYKQAGNSIVVRCLELIIGKLFNSTVEVNSHKKMLITDFV